MDTPACAPAHHRLPDDLQGLVTGTLFVALGVLMYQHAGLLTGGTAGLARGRVNSPQARKTSSPYCIGRRSDP